MRQSENKITSQIEQATDKAEEPIQSNRRRFVARAAAAPVLLSVAGRSALATTNCQDVPKGLSPIAWLSVHPKQGTTTCVSHTVSGNPLGRSPGYWTPNKSGSCFQGPWPATVSPFTICWRVKSKQGQNVQYEQVNWTGAWASYTDMLFYYPVNTQQDAGWNTGTHLPWLDGGNRSLSKILIDENGGSAGILWHITAAYLNALTFPGYALTTAEVQYLYENRRLVPGSYFMTDDEIRSFLSQTWN